MLSTWRTTVSLDLHQQYGIDTGDPAVWGRPWWWMRERILGLLDIPGPYPGVPGTRFAAVMREQLGDGSP